MNILLSNTSVREAAPRHGLRLQVALQGSAMDPTTGTIDMDLIQTGISAGDRTLRAQLTQEVRALIQRTSRPHCSAILCNSNVFGAAVWSVGVHGSVCMFELLGMEYPALCQ